MPTFRTRRLAAYLSLAFLVACSDETNGSDTDSGTLLPVGDGGLSSTADSSVSFPGFDGGPSGADAGFAPFDGGTLTLDGSLPSADGAVVSTDGGGVFVPPTAGYMRGPAPTKASASGTAVGPYKVSNIAMGYRDGPDFADATLYWPSDAEPPFAAVAIVPGFVSGQSDIQPWGPFFASHGIVTMTIGTNTPADLPDARAKALLDALESIRQENTRMGSALNGKLDLSRLATMGWSMGGGGTLLAAQQTPALKATISMCAWNPGFSYSTLKVPAFMFAAKGDGLADGQSQGFYTSIPAGTPKELWEAPGEGQVGGHYMFNTPKNVMGTVGLYGLSWLKVFLEGDERYRDFLKEKPANATDFRTTL